jgi:hypothetical protein
MTVPEKGWQTRKTVVQLPVLHTSLLTNDVLHRTISSSWKMDGTDELPSSSAIGGVDDI